MKIYFGADHGGYRLKESLIPWLKSLQHEVRDCGNFSYDSEDDYPDFAELVAKKVIADEGSLGILICKTGSGMVITANKIKGIRAVDCYNKEITAQAKNHLNANIICFGGEDLAFDEIKELINLFLNTAFSDEERHQRRLAKIIAIEEH